MGHTLRWDEPRPFFENAVPTRGLIIALAIVAAVSELAGATALLVWRNGSANQPLTLLDHTPFTSFVIPALLLGLVVGGTSIACAILVWRRAALAIDATVLAGGALTVWIVAEVALMRSFHPLHAMFGALGVALLALGARAAWSSGLRRHRWILTVTAAETIGYLAPTLTGVLTAKAGIEDERQSVAIVAAGFIEGLMLGAGQAWALPVAVRRGRYALLTSLGAGLVWASVMTMMSVGPRPMLIAAVAIVGLGAIGTMQWLELRHQAEHAWSWIPWTALAWTVALPLSFSPAPLVDESTPLPSHLVLWGCGGALMAYVMSLVTWQGAKRLRPRPV